MSEVAEIRPSPARGPAEASHFEGWSLLAGQSLRPWLSARQNVQMWRRGHEGSLHLPRWNLKQIGPSSSCRIGGGGGGKSLPLFLPFLPLLPLPLPLLPLAPAPLPFPEKGPDVEAKEACAWTGCSADEEGGHPLEEVRAAAAPAWRVKGLRNLVWHGLLSAKA